MLEAANDDLLALLAERLRALGDPMRLRLMRALAGGERTVGELVALVGTSQPNVSRHIHRLEQAGWVARRRAGGHVLVRIADDISPALCDELCGLVRRQVTERARALEA